MLARCLLSILAVTAPIALPAQARQAGATAAAASAAAALPPATKLEAFKPAAGTVVTFGYDELGNVNGAAVDVREVRETKGATVRGAVVTVNESEYRRETAFVDTDEIPELLRGIDALLAVQSNPTTFKNFEVRYNTRGDLRLTAFNNSRNQISYSIEAGRVSKAQTFVDAGDLRKFREMFVAAQQKLAAP
jgi:hypothetical protein